MLDANGLAMNEMQSVVFYLNNEFHARFELSRQ
jgi:hypothetical protein